MLVLNLAPMFFISHASANLGEADLAVKDRTFDAWCSVKGNDCKVTISDNNTRISVNGGSGVRREQIVLLVHRQVMRPDPWKTVDFDYNYEIKYKDLQTGQARDALIIFANLNTAIEFDKYFFRLSGRPVIRVSDLLWTDHPELFSKERGGEFKELSDALKGGDESINMILQQQQQMRNAPVNTSPSEVNIKVGPRSCTTTKTWGGTSTNCY